MPRLEFKDVRITYRIQTDSGPDTLAAVDGVDLVVEPGSTLGLAGESGCGKSTLAMSVLRLLPANATVQGSILLGDENVSELSWGRLRTVRWTEASIVFQGAMHSLNPVRKVRDQIGEALLIHSRDSAPANAESTPGAADPVNTRAKYKDDAVRLARVAELLDLVDLPPAKGASYPHELSGGQKQRVMIAMALACDPELIIADEPTTALDVVVQAQVLNVITGLVRSRGLSLVMISHDLSVLAATCERIVVMQRGKIVEDGPSGEVMRNPQHPHTRALASAFPLIGDMASRLRLPGYTAPDAPAATAAEKAGKFLTPDPADVVLEARNLSVTFAGRSGNVRAVDAVHLQCGRGEIVALVGQSGSGKTTLARTLLGLQRPSGGQVFFEGKVLDHRRRALKAYRKSVQ
ncbi:MAG TPA: ATP-binding cassette domain-containing protein, partial [Micrococcaceae bacterium]